VFRAYLRRIQNPRQTPDLNYDLQLNTRFWAMVTLEKRSKQNIRCTYTVLRNAELQQQDD